MINESLCFLVREALQYPAASPERQRTREVLSLAIDQLPEIKKRLEPGLRPYYEEALPQTMRDIEQNLDKFPVRYGLEAAQINCQNPSEANFVRECFVKWVGMILKGDCLDKARKKRRPKYVSTSKRLGAEEVAKTVEDTIKDLTLSGLDLLLEQNDKFIARELKDYIEQDPENKLKNCYPTRKPAKPHLNCQALVKMRFLQEPPPTLKEMAASLNASFQTIDQRLNKNCLPLLREIARELGYE